jgi:hypothetical protein
MVIWLALAGAYGYFLGFCDGGYWMFGVQYLTVGSFYLAVPGSCSLLQYEQKETYESNRGVTVMEETHRAYGSLQSAVQ